LVDFQWTTRHYIPEDSTLHNHSPKNLKSYKIVICSVTVSQTGDSTTIIAREQLCEHVVFLFQCDSDTAKPNESEIAIIHRNKKIQSTEQYTEHVHFHSTLLTKKEMRQQQLTKAQLVHLKMAN
jgi:hypothetical protein